MCANPSIPNIPSIPSIPNMSSSSLLRSYENDTPIRHTIGRDTAYGVIKTVDAAIRYQVIDAAWGISYETLRDFGAAHYRRVHENPPALENYQRSCQVYKNGAWKPVGADTIPAEYPAVTDFHLYHNGTRYNALRHSDTGAVYVYTADKWDYIGTYNPISNTIQSQTVEPRECLAFRTFQDGHIAEDVAEAVLQTSAIIPETEATLTIRRKGELDSWGSITFYNVTGSWYASERKSWGETNECAVTTDYLELLTECLKCDDNPNYPIELVELYVPGFPEIAMTRESFLKNAGLVERCLKAFMDL
jgi:hypothetical protein